MAGERATDFAPLEILPGIFTKKTPTGANRRWQAGDNVRWDEDDQPQKMGGFLQNPLLDPDDDSEEIEYMGKARSYHEWESLDGQSWIAFGTACKLYLINNNTLYDITPLRKQSYLTDGIATVNGSSVITITDVDHSAQDGDHFTIEGGATVAGLTLSGEYDILKVLTQDTFTVDVGTAANATTTGGGSMTLRYDISCGLESDGPLYGYGVGPYGEETYGTARTESTLIGHARTWSLDNWGEDLLASPNGGSLYVWRRDSGPQSRATLIPGAPINIEKMLVGPDNKHVIAMGTNLAAADLTPTGQQDKMFIRWCVQDDYEDWVVTDENDAGSKRLDVGSALITAVKSDFQLLGWSDKALYICSLVGGLDVYEWKHKASSPRLASPNAAIDIDGTVYAMTIDDFYIYDGTYRILECDVKNVVFGDGHDGRWPGLNRDQLTKITTRARRAFNEIWWSYPEDDSGENNINVIYNYEKKCWYFSSTPRETGGDMVNAYGYPIGLYDGKMWLEENGVDYGTDEALPAFLESWETQLADGTAVAEVVEMVPDFMRLTGSVDISMFGRDKPHALRDIGPTRTITENTKQITAHFKRRQIGFRIESTAVGDDWRMGTWKGKLIPHGR